MPIPRHRLQNRSPWGSILVFHRNIAIIEDPHLVPFWEFLDQHFETVDPARLAQLMAPAIQDSARPLAIEDGRVSGDRTAPLALEDCTKGTPFTLAKWACFVMQLPRP